MTNENYRAEESLTRELQELRPYILRQQRAEAVRPDAHFAKSLRARLVGTVEPTPILERLRRVIATLVPAPQPRLGLAGVRSAGNTPQPVTYSAEDLQVAISLEQGVPAAHTVRGMIFSATHSGQDLEQTRVVLLQEDRVLLHTAVDQFGAFTLADVQPGNYIIHLAFPDRIVVIPDLSINA